MTLQNLIEADKSFCVLKCVTILNSVFPINHIEIAYLSRIPFLTTFSVTVTFFMPGIILEKVPTFSSLLNSAFVVAKFGDQTMYRHGWGVK